MAKIERHIVKQEGGAGSILAVLNHREDAERLSATLKLDYPNLSFPVSTIEVEADLWTKLYDALWAAVPIDREGR